MENQVALYLFRNKTCTLPGIGKLSITTLPAQYLGMNEKIVAPKPIVTFEQDAVYDNHISEWLAAKNSIPVEIASKQIEEFSRKIKALKGGEKFSIPATGEFFIDGSGSLQFHGAEINAAFTPDATAITLARTADHSILVGDTESNTTEMTAYFADAGKSRIAAWKIISLILFIVVSAYLTWFFYAQKGIGNFKKIDVHSEPASTYSTKP